MKSDIQIRNSADVCYIDIEGTIGVPEQWQFASPDDRVATYEKFRDAVARIAALDAEVTTRCYGYVASAATLIAQAASEGRREISAGTLSLVHAAACAAEGNAAELEARAELLRKTDERLAALYARRSGRPQEEFAQRMAENNGNGRWLSPEETVAAGLADRIVEEAKRPKANGRPCGTSRAAGTGCWRRSVCTARRLPPTQRGRRTAATSSTSTTRIRPPAVRRSKPPKGSGATVQRRCLRPKTRPSAKSAARPTKRPMPPTRGSSRRGYNGGRFPKNRREDLPPNSCSAFGSSQKHKKKGMKSILTFTLGKFRSFDSAFPARSRFTTFCHQKVAPKVSAGRKTREPADGLRLKHYADKLAPAFSTAHPPPVLHPDFSQCGTVVRFAQR